VDPELLAKLQALGISPGNTPEWQNTSPVDAAQLPSVRSQREILERIRDTLKKQLGEDLAQLEAARMELERVRNGGGS
jgi:hypothetical protein